MKYIRTKDGKIICYEVINETDMSDDFIYSYGAVMKGKKEGFEIEKIADTIEELCDELVFEWHRSSIDHDNGTWHLYHEISLKEEIENALDDGFRASKEEVKNIYGAIWTDKGLIFVAKMNNEGELELL